MKVSKKAHNLLRHNTRAMLEKSYIEAISLGALSLPKSVMAFQTSCSVKSFTRSRASSRLIELKAILPRNA